MPIAAKACVVCGHHVSYPNVRMAERNVERVALADRVSAAFAVAQTKGSEPVLHKFHAATMNSKAVIARPVEDLDYITTKENRLISTYYHMTTEGGSRTPELNEWDPARDRNDSTINPHYYRELHFAALSLDGVGVGWYGACHVTLKDTSIESRTSLFEVSGVAFNTAMPMIAKGLPDPGHRAPWPRRADLAVAKLGDTIDVDTSESEFPGILIERADGTGDTDFIEVHVYGSLHPKAFERVLADNPADEADLAIWRRTKSRLEALGVKVEPVTHA